MASKHEAIKIQVMSDWCVQGRGRLYIMTQGTFRAMYSDAVVRVSPFPKRNKGFPDLFGFELIEIEHDGTEEYSSKECPIFTVVEVKTKNDRVKPNQRRYLDWAVTQGIRAYVAIEDDSEAGYELKEWGK